MCGRVNIRGQVYLPGNRFHIDTIKGETIGRWGDIYNARIETLDTKWDWMINNRGILVIQGFYEKDRYIRRLGSDTINLGILYDPQRDNQFAVITKAAQAPINTIHHRMPLIIENTHDWMFQGLTHIQDYQLDVR